MDLDKANREKEAAQDKPLNFSNNILSARRSQNDFEGNPCCLMAISFLCRGDPLRMKKTDLDETLFDGDQAYRAVLANARAVGVAYTDAQCLELDDLRFVDHCIQSQGKAFQIEVINSGYGLADENLEHNIMESLIDAFRHSDKALVLSMDKWVAVRQAGPFFVLFNSHCVNNFGIIEGFESAKAFVNKSLKGISKLIIAGASTSIGSQFEIHAIKVVCR